MGFEIVSGVLKKYEGNEKDVVIPEGVREIGDYAFYGAHMMETVSFPDTLKAIGMNAFYDCACLKEAILPESLEYLAPAVFSRCSGLKRVWLPDSLTSLPRVTFFQCEKLAQIHLPKKLIRIGRACFEQCRSLDVIAFAESLQVLEENAFALCSGLEAIFLPQTLEEIGKNAFIGCEKLQEITIGKNVKTIGGGALETWGSLKLCSDSALLIRPMMLDNRWNMYWNPGSVKIEKKYLLHDSYLPFVDLNEWKPDARVILAVNYLESYRGQIGHYETWIREHVSECMEMIVSRKRYHALRNAVTNNIFTSEDILPWLDRIRDRDEKAWLLKMNQDQRSQDELTDLDLDELF
ncbi:MAG: leucine-rich repeat domain-containing protein [Solobacterium sp.]|nr:leucine-rich repeat domain-containing protein [Solobacterium sp.]